MHNQAINTLFKDSLGFKNIRAAVLSLESKNTDGTIKTKGKTKWKLKLNLKIFIVI